MRRCLCALLAVLSLTLTACVEDCGCRPRRGCHEERPANQLKSTEAWPR